MSWNPMNDDDGDCDGGEEDDEDDGDESEGDCENYFSHSQEWKFSL